MIVVMSLAAEFGKHRGAEKASEENAADQEIEASKHPLPAAS
jgi:hypothetical protein